MDLFGKVKDGLRSGRDMSASMLARRLLQQRFSKYGQVTRLQLDSKNKQIHAEVLLTGEQEPLTIAVHRYEIVVQGADQCFIVREASASRSWMNHALNDFVIGRSFSIPRQYTPLVAHLL